mmetsp:Transcript_119548/g.234998  ORF Transcript_119548/g.234998 Transcript_119548/m.234998 type:complete len:125 (-) Transcript_119548:332-706(-)
MCKEHPAPWGEQMDDAVEAAVPRDEDGVPHRVADGPRQRGHVGKDGEAIGALLHDRLAARDQFDDLHNDNQTKEHGPDSVDLVGPSLDMVQSPQDVEDERNADVEAEALHGAFAQREDPDQQHW